MYPGNSWRTELDKFLLMCWGVIMPVFSVFMLFHCSSDDVVLKQKGGASIYPLVVWPL